MSKEYQFASRDAEVTAEYKVKETKDNKEYGLLIKELWALAEASAKVIMKARPEDRKRVLLDHVEQMSGKYSSMETLRFRLMVEELIKE